MRKSKYLLAATALLALSAAAPAQDVGDRVTKAKEFKALFGFANGKAKSYGDFAGRTVLLEFFAFW